MIEQEIGEILAERTDGDERLNDVVDQFRCGRDVGELLGLLDSGNAEVVSIGAWILGELPFERYNSESIVLRLRGLTNHVDPTVRFNALTALYPTLVPGEAITKEILQKLLGDSNDGVRKAAKAAASRLSLI